MGNDGCLIRNLLWHIYLIVGKWGIRTYFAPNGVAFRLKHPPLLNLKLQCVNRDFTTPSHILECVNDF